MLTSRKFMIIWKICVIMQRNWSLCHTGKLSDHPHSHTSQNWYNSKDLQADLEIFKPANFLAILEFQSTCLRKLHMLLLWAIGVRDFKIFGQSFRPCLGTPGKSKNQKIQIPITQQNFDFLDHPGMWSSKKLK